MVPPKPPNGELAEDAAGAPPPNTEVVEAVGTAVGAADGAAVLGVSEDPNGGLEAAVVEVAPPNTELDAAAVPPPKTDEPEAVEAGAPKTDFEAGAELPKTDELLAVAVVLVIVGAVPEGLAPPKAELTAAVEPPKTEAPVLSVGLLAVVVAAMAPKTEPPNAEGVPPVPPNTDPEVAEVRVAPKTEVDEAVEAGAAPNKEGACFGVVGAVVGALVPDTIDGIGTVFVEVTEVGCVEIIVPPGIEVLAVTEVLAGGAEDAKPPKAGGFAALTAGAGLVSVSNGFAVAPPNIVEEVVDIAPNPKVGAEVLLGAPKVEVPLGAPPKAEVLLGVPKVEVLLGAPPKVEVPLGAPKVEVLLGAPKAEVPLGAPNAEVPLDRDKDGAAGASPSSEGVFVAKLDNPVTEVGGAPRRLFRVDPLEAADTAAIGEELNEKAPALGAVPVLTAPSDNPGAVVLGGITSFAAVDAKLKFGGWAEIFVKLGRVALGFDKVEMIGVLSGTFGASVLASKAKDCLALVSVIFKACTNSLLLGGSDDFLTNSDLDLANSGSGFTLAVPFFCRICLNAVAFSGENPCPGE